MRVLDNLLNEVERRIAPLVKTKKQAEEWTALVIRHLETHLQEEMLFVVRGGKADVGTEFDSPELLQLRREFCERKGKS